MLTQSPQEGAAQAREEPLQDETLLPAAAPAEMAEEAVLTASPVAVAPEIDVQAVAEPVVQAPFEASGAGPVADAAPEGAVVAFEAGAEDAAPEAATIIPFPLAPPAAQKTEPEVKPAPRAVEAKVEHDAAPPAPEPHQRAGERLVRARTRLGLSLDDASQRLRIRRDYLAALEDMNLKLLPGKAYAIPYLRSYARLLQLDPEGVISQFQAESALSREDVTPQIRNPESKPRRERPWIWALALVGVAAGFVLYRGLFAPHETQPPGQTQAQTNTAAPKGAAGTRPVAPAVQGDGLPFGVAAQKVELRASALAWLEVRTPNGTVMFSQDLGPGQVYQPDAGAGWTLHTRDGGLFEVYVNGVSVGLLGEAGAPVLGRQVDAIAAAAMPAEPAAPAPGALAAPQAPAIVPSLPSLNAPTGQGLGGQGASAGVRQRPVDAPPRAMRPQQPQQPRVAVPKAVQPAPATGSRPDSWEIGETPASPPPAAPAPAPAPAPTPAPSSAAPPPA